MNDPILECPGPGRCHGSMSWCDRCGDVVAVCDSIDCMGHYMVHHPDEHEPGCCPAHSDPVNHGPDHWCETRCGCRVADVGDVDLCRIVAHQTRLARRYDVDYDSALLARADDELRRRAIRRRAGDSPPGSVVPLVYGVGADPTVLACLPERAVVVDATFADLDPEYALVSVDRYVCYQKIRGKWYEMRAGGSHVVDEIHLDYPVFVGSARFRLDAAG